MMYRWTGSGRSGDMQDPDNYEPRGVPGVGDAVSIPLPPSKDDERVLRHSLTKLIHCIACDIRFTGAESGLAHECPGCGCVI